jgi:hypothetical protein
MTRAERDSMRNYLSSWEKRIAARVGGGKLTEAQQMEKRAYELAWDALHEKEQDATRRHWTKEELDRASAHLSALQDHRIRANRTGRKTESASDKQVDDIIQLAWRAIHLEGIRTSKRARAKADDKGVLFVERVSGGVERLIQ